MIALREVEVNGGRRQVIDLPLLDPLFSILSPPAANYRIIGKVKPRTGSHSTHSAPRLGKHNAALPAEIGVGAEELETLFRDRVVCGETPADAADQQ